MRGAMLAASAFAAWLALIWSAVLMWLAIGAVIRRTQLQTAQRALAAAGQPATLGRRVVLIRPCAGAEPGLRDNLLSIARVSTGARLRIVFCVDHVDDGARPIAAEVADQLRAAGLDVRVEIHPPTGPNRKASMLAAVLREHADEHELVVNIDSNVDLDHEGRGFDLDGLLQPVLGPGRVGVCWAPWSELRGFAGLGPRASEAVLGGSLTSFPLLCALHPNGLVGKIWAARIDALDSTGEFAELAGYLGEDLAMAARLRAAGWTIAVAPGIGRARGGQPSFAQVIERFGRWMLVVRGQEPRLLHSYPLFFFATPLVGVIAAFGIPGRPELALMALGLAFAARLLVTFAARFWSGRGLRPVPALVDVVLSDLVLMLAWIRAMSRREVEWRGHRLRVEPGGQLTAID
jgi:ceramide glucosyltransferase